MAAYSIDGRDTNTANTSILALTGSTTARPRIAMVMTGGAGGAPADDQVEYHLQRYTAAGTSTGVTPQKLDPGGIAAISTAGEAHSVEPTYTANEIVLIIPRNMRAQSYWQAAHPDFELVIPATAANGIGVRSVTVSNAWSDACVMHFRE